MQHIRCAGLVYLAGVSFSSNCNRALRRSEDFALNANGLDHVVKAEADGRLKEGYVVLAKQNAGAALEYIAAARAADVSERLRNIPPYEGKWGPYHWITTNFQPASSGRDAEEPF
jgi:hypothetical protein